MSHIEAITLDELWQSAPTADQQFDPQRLGEVPTLARQYFTGAIAPNAPLFRAARITMRGEMKLGARWLPFEATQVIHGERGFIWQAKMRMGIVTIRGSDRFVDCEGYGQWRLLGLIPLASDGPNPDMNRSAAARFRIESMWLPSMLVDNAQWNASSEDELEVIVDIGPYSGSHRLTLGAEGRVRTAVMQRWGKMPGSDTYSEAPFGAIIEDYATFEGYTVPSKVRVGWHPSVDGFEAGGEFWRGQIEAMEFR